MATYHQYSEIVAAYGYRLPPPPPPQASRVGLALLYAAVGVALGTFTGTALAVATLPQQASVLPHVSFAKAFPADFRIHPIANAGQTPVIQIHANNQVASAAPLPPALAPAAPAPAIENTNANPSAAPTLLIHQAPSFPTHATSSPADASSLPATSIHATAPAASPVQAPVILSQSVIAAANAGKPQILTLASIVHPAPATHAQSVKPVSSESPSVQIAVAEPNNFNVQPMQKQTSTDNPLAASVPAALPLATPAQPQPPVAPSAAPLNSVSLSSGLDAGFKPLPFYSEGDATVVSYDATGDTITTDDGRSFVIGSTVSESHAISWQDYRSNVHYRCDQSGNCSLVRTGVIALNAKLF
jgi:hypothetical protein